jgi:hypothetical protein
VFYRGQNFPKVHHELTLSMRAQGKIEVVLRQSDAAKIRDHGDQFLRHRNQGFLHPGSTRLACKMDISHDFGRATVVRVKHGFPDLTPELTVKNVTLMPGRNNTEVEFVVDSGRNQFSDDRPREYLVEIYPEKDIKAKDGKATPLYRNQFPFRVLKPEEILAIEFAGFVAEEGVVYVVVRHLVSDPVSGPVDVAVTIGGNTPGTHKQLRRGQTEFWWVSYPAEPPPKIPVVVRLNNLPNATIKQEILTGPEPPPANQGAAAPASAGGSPKPPAL